MNTKNTMRNYVGVLNSVGPVILLVLLVVIGIITLTHERYSVYLGSVMDELQALWPLTTLTVAIFIVSIFTSIFSKKSILHRVEGLLWTIFAGVTFLYLLGWGANWYVLYSKPSGWVLLVFIICLAIAVWGAIANYVYAHKIKQLDR